MVEVTLTITSPTGSQQILVQGATLSIGRTGASDMVIADDHGLSRRHVTVHRQDDEVWVVDEGSTNGTLLNGRIVTAEGRRLSHGDEIRIGDHTVITVGIREAATAEMHHPPPVASAPAAHPSLLKFLIPAMVMVALLLGAVGFGLYQLTRNDDSAGTASVEEILEDTHRSGTMKVVTIETPPAPSPTPVALATPISTPEIDVAPPPTPPGDLPARRKLYQTMSEEERFEFIKKRAQHIAIMMGKRAYAFTPESLVHIKFWLDAFARRVGNGRRGLWGGDTIYILERGKQHAPVIIRAFNQYRVPYVIGLYIPFIETEYTNISTDNYAGAAGLFQFLGPTAEGYGVPRAERTNVARMAPAAARYFRDNMMNFGDDSMSVALSIAGYNRNPESVKRDLRNVLNAPNNEDKERSFWTLIANQGKLDEAFQRENINYVPRFFAAAILGETPWAFGIEMRPLSTYAEMPATASLPDAPLVEP